MRGYRSKVLIPLTLVALFVIVYPAGSFAKGKKYTLDQAWAICKAEIDKTVPRDASGRYAAGGACLLQHGYKICTRRLRVSGRDRKG